MSNFDTTDIKNMTDAVKTLVWGCEIGLSKGSYNLMEVDRIITAIKLLQSPLEKKPINKGKDPITPTQV